MRAIQDALGDGILLSVHLSVFYYQFGVEVGVNFVNLELIRADGHGLRKPIGHPKGGLMLEKRNEKRGEGRFINH